MNTFATLASLSDEDLIAEVVDRSEKAFEELCRRHLPLLRTVIRRIMYTEADCDDVLQDVYLQVWNQAHKFSSEKGNLKAWLVTLARRRALDRVRQRTAYQAATSRFEAEAQSVMSSVSEFSAVDDEVQHHELHVLLEDMIETQLPKEQGDAVRLTYFKGLSQRQIAAHLSLPLGTVKTRIELGMRKLSHSRLLRKAA
jgi:RNA polymerase sigma-70 factor (ECF subfamily)